MDPHPARGGRIAGRRATASSSDVAYSGQEFDLGKTSHHDTRGSDLVGACPQSSDFPFVLVWCSSGDNRLQQRNAEQEENTDFRHHLRLPVLSDYICPAIPGVEIRETASDGSGDFPTGECGADGLSTSRCNNQINRTQCHDRPFSIWWGWPVAFYDESKSSDSVDHRVVSSSIWGGGYVIHATILEDKSF